jgi:ketosteroid isomerase-like protein
MKTHGYRVISFATLCALSACSSADGEVLSLDDDEVLSIDGQLEIIEQRLDATNTRDWDRWESLHTDDAVRTAPELEQPIEGASGMRAAIETLSVAFPDYHLELRQAFGGDEWLAVRLHTSGTMSGPLTLSDGAVVPATGQRIEQDWAALVQFRGARISEFHEFYDQLDLMMQLGLIAP